MPRCVRTAMRGGGAVAEVVTADILVVKFHIIKKQGHAPQA
jgi:hypothetical protein